MNVSFQVGDIHIGSGDFFLVAGPCVIESEEHAIRMAEIIKGVVRSLNIPYIFKASYDKANRTSIRSFRGPGLKEGLRILNRVKDEVHLPVLTDVHEAADVGKVAEVADVIQVPAFLSRQTDLVVAAALSGRAVNLKKGQFVAPWDMRHAVSGGQPEFIPLLTRAAVAAGVDGVFMEVHDNPKEAKSDGANALESTKLRGVLKELLAVRKALAEAHATP